MKASHILYDNPDQCNEGLAAVKSAPETFEAVAKKHSRCPSGRQNGSLGTFSEGQMVPEFEAAVKSLKPQELGNSCVKTQFGYHIVRRD